MLRLRYEEGPKRARGAGGAEIYYFNCSIRVCVL